MGPNGFFVIAVVLALALLGIAAAASSNRRRLKELRGTETSSSQELVAVFEAIAVRVGEGTFRQTAEVKGTVECQAPLVSELSRTSCVSYTMEVLRKHPSQIEDQDFAFETIVSSARRVPFHVRDETGTVAVDPEGATINDEEVFSHEVTGKMDAETFRFGSYHIDFDPRNYRDATFGLRFRETAVPLGRRVYVLGEATDPGGRLRIGWPTEGDRTFLISLKSEEELARRALTSVRRLSVTAAVFACLTVAALVAGIVGKVLGLRG